MSQQTSKNDSAWETMMDCVRRLANAARNLEAAEIERNKAEKKLAEFRAAAVDGVKLYESIGGERLARMNSAVNSTNAWNEREEGIYRSKLNVLMGIPAGPGTLAPPVPLSVDPEIFEGYEKWFLEIVSALPIDSVKEAEDGIRKLEAARDEYETAKRAYVVMIDSLRKSDIAIHESRERMAAKISEAKALNRRILAAREAELADVRKRLGE